MSAGLHICPPLYVLNTKTLTNLIWTWSKERRELSLVQSEIHRASLFDQLSEHAGNDDSLDTVPDTDADDWSWPRLLLSPQWGLCHLLLLWLWMVCGASVRWHHGHFRNCIIKAIFLCRLDLLWTTASSLCIRVLWSGELMMQFKGWRRS